MIVKYAGGTIVVGQITSNDDHRGDQSKDDVFADHPEFVEDEEIDEMIMRYEGHEGLRLSGTYLNTNGQVTDEMGDQPKLSQDHGVAGQMMDEEDQDWLGSQHDQESFADQTLTYCILKELEDQS